jgi:hypothetical protein
VFNKPLKTGIFFSGFAKTGLRASKVFLEDNNPLSGGLKPLFLYFNLAFESFP